MNFNKGQSLIELIVAVAIFGIAVSSIAIFLLDSYVSGRLAQEITQANFLAEEGLEAAKSIRDNKWANLTVGDHGLAITGNNWVFQGTSEDLSTQFKTGAIRVVSVENIGSGRRKVTSRVGWQFSEGRPKEISLVTYLTNWSKSGAYLTQNVYRWRNDDGTE